MKKITSMSLALMTLSLIAATDTASARACTEGTTADGSSRWCEWLCVSPGSTLHYWDFLDPGEQIWSANNSYMLTLQKDDGNLVLYGPNGAVWSAANTRPGEYPRRFVTMSGGGALQMHERIDALPDFPAQTIWRTSAHPELSIQDYPCLKVQDDGKLCVYAGRTGTAYACTRGDIGWELL